MKLSLIEHLLFLFPAVLVVHAQPQQQYNDYYADDGNYGGDTLYQDYAEGREMKAQGGGGMSMVKTAAFGLTGWFLGGKIHSKRAVKKANQQSQKDLKTLYSRYVTDVTALQSEISELQNFIKDSTKQQLRDEFLMADTDGNLLVSRTEFEQHKKRYLRNHPENAHLFPAFEDFDPDHNGLISIDEHEEYYKRRNMI